MNLRVLMVAAALALVVPMAACAHGYHGRYYSGYVVYAPGPPPPPPPVVLYRAPGPGFVWIDGYWGWRNRWAWTPGRWVRPPFARAVWAPGYWYRAPRGWGWRAGYWR